MSFLRRLFGLAPRADAPSESADATGATGDAGRIAEVESILAELRPLFRADGGDMRVHAVLDDGTVLLRPTGSCHGCQVSQLTLQGALRPRLRERCDWFTDVRFA